jgi:hypothetical protein
MKKRYSCCRLICFVAAILAATIGYAATIAVPNGDFEDWQSIGTTGGTTNAGWASVPGGFTPATNVGRSDEMWTNPSSFASGWQSNGPAGLNGKYGLQHASASQHQRAIVPGPLTGPEFSGNFIGFVNLDDPDGFEQSIQSGILGNLQAGVYTLTVAVGARANQGSWNDVGYDISLVADPILNAPDNGGPATGSRDGTVLGTPSSVTMVPSTATVGTNQQDLVYTLNVGSDDPNVGAPFAIRIGVSNTLAENGVPDPADGDHQFTQGNFDNVRLEYVPEPGCCALLGSLFGVAFARRRLSKLQS